MSLRYSAVSAACAIFAFGAIALGFFWTHHERAGGSSVHFTSEVDHWEDRIRSLGPDSAYQQMAKEARSLPVSDGHILAHSFGEALFRTKGVAGSATCDDQFVYGCYHQFIGTAISELGLSAIPQLRASCTAKPNSVFSCNHGIGHGILGYLGYTDADLAHALDLCGSDAAGLQKAEKACADGVFMEYNIRELTTYESGRIIPRTFSSDTVYSPCLSVSEKYRNICAHELPDWWIAAMATPNGLAARFAKAGTYCSGMHDAGLVRACFEGIGHVAAPLSDLVPDQARSLCEAASSNSNNRTACLFAVVRRFDIEGVSGYMQLCGQFGFTGDTLAQCRAFSAQLAM